MSNICSCILSPCHKYLLQCKSAQEQSYSIGGYVKTLYYKSSPCLAVVLKITPRDSARTCLHRTAELQLVPPCTWDQEVLSTFAIVRELKTLIGLCLCPFRCRHSHMSFLHYAGVHCGWRGQEQEVDTDACCQAGCASHCIVPGRGSLWLSSPCSARCAIQQQ